MTASIADDARERAVVVGMSGATGLAVARALRDAGVAALALHHDDSVPGFATAAAVCRRCPDWRRDGDAFVAALVDAGREAAAHGGRASLFVADDSALDGVWAARDRLRAAGLVPAFSFSRPPGEVLDKREQARAARRAGVDAPWTEWAHDSGDAGGLDARADDFGYPLLVKPAVSHAGVDAIGGKAISCGGPAELRAALRRAAQLGVEVIVQDFVPGADDQLYTAGIFRGGGQCLVFTGRKLRQHPPTLGIARLAEALEVPEIVAGSVRLCAELGYEGVAQVEYKRDARDGRYRLMEVNFRPWTWIGLATACGVPLVAAAHAWAMGARHEATQAEPGGDASGAGRGRPDDRAEAFRLRQGTGRWIWVVPEAASALRGLAHRERPELGPWRRLKAEAFFSRRDPAPFRRAVAAPFARRLAALDRRLAALKRAVDRLARPPAFVVNGCALAARTRRERTTPPVTGLPPGNRVLVLAPHPDDETIMCGATLAASARRGDAVRVVAVTSGAATEVAAAAAGDVAAVREAELGAAAAELGVRDVVFLRFADHAVAGSQAALADLLAGQVRDFAPTDIYVPFPHDVHPDHVATSLALAEALADAAAGGGSVAPTGPSSVPEVHCGFVQTPASPEWVTRVVRAGRDRRAKRRAVAAYASRGTAIFAKPLQLAWFNPGSFLRRSEAFVDLSADRYTALCRTLRDEGFTAPPAGSPWHPLLTVYELERARVERAHIAVSLAAARSG